jgi:endonuclease YncB( thermonuclease family)
MSSLPKPSENDITILSNYSSKTPKFTLSGKNFVGKCVHVYDGDTVHVVFSTAEINSGVYKWVIRLTGIDTPEMKSKNQVEKDAALRARDYLRGEILDKIVIVECGEFDKYGRLLGKIHINDSCVNNKMIELGHAKAYDGGTKEGWN